MRIYLHYDTDEVLILDQPCHLVTRYKIYSHGKLLEESTVHNMSIRAVHKQAVNKWKYVDLNEELRYE